MRFITIPGTTNINASQPMSEPADFVHFRKTNGPTRREFITIVSLLRKATSPAGKFIQSLVVAGRDNLSRLLGDGL